MTFPLLVVLHLVAVTLMCVGLAIPDSAVTWFGIAVDVAVCIGLAAWVRWEWNR